MNTRQILYALCVLCWLVGAGFMAAAGLAAQAAMYVTMAMLFLIIGINSGDKHTSYRADKDNHASPDEHTDTPSQPGERK